MHASAGDRPACTHMGLTTANAHADTRERTSAALIENSEQRAWHRAAQLRCASQALRACRHVDAAVFRMSLRAVAVSTGRRSRADHATQCLFASRRATQCTPRNVRTIAGRAHSAISSARRPLDQRLEPLCRRRRRATCCRWSPARCMHRPMRSMHAHGRGSADADAHAREDVWRAADGGASCKVRRRSDAHQNDSRACLCRRMRLGM